MRVPIVHCTHSSITNAFYSCFPGPRALCLSPAYQFYPHGPVSRLELGERQIQGIDYAYTLQGWLKAVNSTSLGTNKPLGTYDLGSDGLQNSNPNTNFAPDAFGFGLDYYHNDYQASGASDFLADISGSSNPAHSRFRSLYNGNIGRMTVALQNQNEVPLTVAMNDYHYDQLNRITWYQSYKESTMGTDNQSTNAQSYGYHTSYSYDRNGNLLELSRHDKSGTTIDSLNYHYDDANPGAPERNRLLHLKDQVGQVLTTDLPDQSGSVDKTNYANNNYEYDAIGNLIRDDAENITNITWNVNGKIARITKTGGDEIAFDYDATGNRIAKYVTTAGTTVATFYVRDAQGNVMATYKHSSAEGLKLTEQHLYGSDRLGVLKAPIDIPATPYSIWESSTYKGERTHEFRISNGQSYQSVQLTSNNNTRLYVIEALEGDVRVQQSSPGFNYLYGNADGTSQGMSVVPAGKKIAFTATRADLLVDGHFLITCEEDFSASSFTGDARMVDHLHADQIFGQKHYELKNHLGNVLSTVSDRKYWKEDTIESELFHSTFDEELGDWRPMENVETQFEDGALRVIAPEPGTGIYYGWSNIDPNCTYEFCIDLLSFEESAVQLIVRDQNGVLILNEVLEEPEMQYCFTISELDGVEDFLFEVVSMEGGSFLIDNLQLKATCTEGVQIANVWNTQDYYPFGMVMPGRNYQGSDGYRYGFNGMEKDDEVKGDGNSYSTEFRKFDPRIGRWFSLDNYAHLYPSISPYSFSANSPLVLKDTDGNLLRDANGNIIVSKTGAAPKIQRMSNGLIITDTEVYIYGNDGTRHKAWYTTVTLDNGTDVSTNAGVVATTYDCHGHVLADGALIIDSPEMEGILEADRNGSLKENAISEAVEGDIILFRDENGDINHSAIYNKDGTLSTKNGIANRLKSNASLESVESIYGENTTAVNPVKDLKINSLSNSGSRGVSFYDQDQVQNAYKNKKETDLDDWINEQLDRPVVEDKLIMGSEAN